MATAGNERYLRHIWLLGEGGLLVLRGIVTRESAKCGHPLETILASKRSFLTSILREQFSLVLFPTSATVNGDVNTWDISLLLLVIKNIFWSKLTPADKSSIGTIQSYRNDIQRHPACLSMTAHDYATNHALLEAAIRQLSIGLSTQKNSEMQDIIQKTASGEIDIGAVFRRIEDLHEFKTILHSLEDKLDHFNSTLPDMNNSLNQIKGMPHGRSEKNLMMTDQKETVIEKSLITSEFLLRPFKSQANKGTETETHGSTPLKLQANEGTETETHEKTKLERRRIWDSMIGRDRLEELATRSYIKEDIEHKKHTHLLEKTKLKPRRESGSMIGRDRLEDLARKTTKEDIEHKKHTHLLEESKLKLDDVISRSAALKKRQTIKRIDEATWDPFVHPVKEHEKTATKAEVEDKTHTTVANKEI